MATATKAPAITPDTTMGEVLAAFPSAKRALFQAYHIGGCHSCGYAPTDTLGTVCASHDITDVDAVIRHIHESQATDDRLQVACAEVKGMLDRKASFRFIDVRSPEEWQMVHITSATLLTEELWGEIMSAWPKDTAIVVHCHSGVRSLDAASFLAGHGFTNVRSMTGGIDAWAMDVDRSLPRY